MASDKNQSEPIKGSIKKNVALNTFYEILSIILPFITAPYVSRVIGTKGVGIYSYTHSYQTFFAMLATLGTISYGTREISRARNDAQLRSRLFWEIELLTVGTTFACILMWLVFTFFAGDDRIYYLVLTMGLLNSAFDIHWFFSGLEQFQYQVKLNTIFRLTGVVLLFVLIHDSSDLLLYIILMTAVNVLSSLSMWIYLPRFLVKVNIRELRIRRHFRQTLIYFIPNAATSIYTVLDKSLIQLITHDAYQNGYYEQATKIINMVKALTFSSLNVVLGSRIAYLFKEQRYDEIRSRIADSIHYILFMGIGCCLGIIGVARRFVPLFFGPGYEGSIILLQLLSPVVIIIGISNCLGTHYYTPAGLRKQSAAYIVAGAVVNLVMNLLLIPRFAGAGAVAGTLVAETTITVLYLTHCSGYLTFRQILLSAWKKLAAGAVMLLFILAADRMIRSSLLAVAVSVAGGAALYLLALILLRDTFVTDFLIHRILGSFIRKIKK